MLTNLTLNATVTLKIEQVTNANAHGKYQSNWSIRSQVIDRKRTGLPTSSKTIYPRFFEGGHHKISVVIIHN